MKRPRRNRAVLFGLYLNAGLLAAVLWAVAGRSGLVPGLSSPAFGSPLQPPPIAGGGSMYLMPAQFSTNVWGCYIMDIDAQTLCAYEFFTGDKTLRLVAARDFHWDRRLKNYNTLPAWPEVQKLVELQNQNVRENPAPPASQPADAPDANK